MTGPSLLTPAGKATMSSPARHGALCGPLLLPGRESPGTLHSLCSLGSGFFSHVVWPRARNARGSVEPTEGREEKGPRARLRYPLAVDLPTVSPTLTQGGDG